MATENKRIKVRQAEDILGWKRTTIFGLVRDGYLTRMNPPGFSGQGKPLLLDEGEVQALATGGKPAVLAYRRMHPRLFGKAKCPS